MSEDMSNYIEEYGFDYIQIDVWDFLRQDKGDVTVGVYTRDDIDDYHSMTDEQYIEFLKKIRADIDKKLKEFGAE